MKMMAMRPLGVLACCVLVWTAPAWPAPGPGGGDGFASFLRDSEAIHIVGEAMLEDAENFSLRCDSVSYDPDTGILKALAKSGNRVTLTMKQEGLSLTCDQLEFDAKTEGYVLKGSARVVQTGENNMTLTGEVIRVTQASAGQTRIEVQGATTGSARKARLTTKAADSPAPKAEAAKTQAAKPSTPPTVAEVSKTLGIPQWQKELAQEPGAAAAPASASSSPGAGIAPADSGIPPAKPTSPEGQPE